MISTIEYLRSRLKTVEDDGYKISKDYFLYKHKVQKSKDDLKDDQELLSIENMALCDQLDKVKVNANNDQAYAVDLYKQKTDNYAERFRTQAFKNESDVRVVGQ